MGLVQQIDSGAVFLRGTVALPNAPAVGSTDGFGGTYVLLGISADNPCRVRLYAKSSSVAIDLPRTTSSFNYSASVALSLDTVLTEGTQSLTFIPPIIATTYAAGLTWYTVQSLGVNPANARIHYYPIESNLNTRTWINIPDEVGVQLDAGQTSSGNFFGSVLEPLPKSFLMLNATSTSQSIRLRLYSRPIEDVPLTEKNRAYGIQPSASSYIISDMLFESRSFIYNISPVLQAYNLEGYLSGSNRLGYIIQNRGSSTQTFSTAIKIYPLED